MAYDTMRQSTNGSSPGVFAADFPEMETGLSAGTDVLPLVASALVALALCAGLFLQVEFRLWQAALCAIAAYIGLLGVHFVGRRTLIGDVPARVAPAPESAAPPASSSMPAPSTTAAAVPRAPTPATTRPVMASSSEVSAAPQAPKTGAEDAWDSPRHWDRAAAGASWGGTRPGEPNPGRIPPDGAPMPVAATSSGEPTPARSAPGRQPPPLPGPAFARSDTAPDVGRGAANPFARVDQPTSANNQMSGFPTQQTLPSLGDVIHSRSTIEPSPVDFSASLHAAPPLENGAVPGIQAAPAEATPVVWPFDAMRQRHAEAIAKSYNHVSNAVPPHAPAHYLNPAIDATFGEASALKMPSQREARSLSAPSSIGSARPTAEPLGHSIRSAPTAPTLPAADPAALAIDDYYRLAGILSNHLPSRGHGAEALFGAFAVPTQQQTGGAIADATTAVQSFGPGASAPAVPLESLQDCAPLPVFDEPMVTEPTGGGAGEMSVGASVPARPLMPPRRLPAAVATALANEARAAVEAQRVDVYIEPIAGLADQRATHYEVSLRLRTQAGQMLAPDEFGPAVLDHGLRSRLDQIALPRIAQLGRWLLERGRTSSVFSGIAGESLADDGFLDVFAAEFAAGAAPRLVLSFVQAEVRAFGPMHHETLATMRDIGIRFAMGDVFDLDMDFADLKGQGFDYVKLDAQVFLEGLPAAHHTVPSADLCRYLAEAGMTVIVDRIANEDVRARVFGFGVLLGQGMLFGRAKPVKADILETKQTSAA